MSRLAAFLNRNRAGALAVSAGLFAAVYVAACVLPGEPGERIQFTLDSVIPYRVPLAGVLEPLIAISANGQVLTNPTYRLETLDADVVRVDSTERRLLGVMRGTAAVRVTYLGATGTPDTVFPVQVVISRLAVNSPALTFTQLGVRTRLSAIALDANNAAVPNVAFTWSSADTTVAVVNDTGLVTAVYEGATTITAEADSVADSSNVTVTQVVAVVRVVPELDTLRALDRSLQFNLFAFDSTGAVLPGAKARWSSSDLSVATVDSTTGIATAERAGTARIMAHVGQAWDSATLVVKQVAWFMRVRPGLDTLTAIDDTGRVSAIGTDSGGSDIPNLLVTWGTNDSTIATVDQTGLVAAVDEGATTITASSGNLSAFATIVVKQEIAAVRVSPDSVGLTGPGDTVRLSAVAVDRNGFIVDGAALTWRSSNGFVATVDTGGLVTAHFDGRTGIVATPAIGGHPDTATVSVTGAPSGALVIQTWTTGSQPDPDGYTAVLDSSSTHQVGTNDSVALTTIAGAHAVELTEFASNCTVGDNPRSVDVPVGDTVLVGFAVSCLGPGDSLLITTTTTGADLDPNGYTVGVDEVCDYYYGCYYFWTAPVGLNETVAFAPIAPGTHTVALLDVAENCTVTGGNPRTVSTSPSVPTHVTFSVTCVQTGSVRVTTATTGADLDPDAYGVWVGGVRYSIGVNDTVTRAGLPPGDYAVSLDRTTLAGNCTLGGPSAVTVTVTGGVIADVAFAVTCAPLAAIRVTVATTGVDPDVDGYLVTAAGDGVYRSGAVAPNGAVVIDRLIEGTYTVTLNGVAGNCTVSGPSAVTVTVTWGVTADLAFAVTCAPLAAIRVTVATTGVDPDADGYLVTVVGANENNSLAVPSNGTVVVAPLRGGTYTVTLEGIAVNCSVTGLGQVTISVAPGDTADVSLDVACTTAELLAVAMSLNGNTDVYLVKSNGTGLMRLTSHAAADAEPTWSASSGRIAFVSQRDGNSELYVMNADGSGQLRLTANPGEDRHPAWSPDGLKLSFESDRDGNPEIYVMNADGSSPVRLTVNGAVDIDPAWSPDGLRIAFASNRNAADLEIYRMNADGSSVTRLTFSGGNRHPDWSPAGTKLVYSHIFCDYYYGCVGDLGVINADGSGQGALPTGEAYDPVWSPDGRWIAFGRYSNVADVAGIRGDGTGLVSMVANAFEPAWRR